MKLDVHSNFIIFVHPIYNQLKGRATAKAKIDMNNTLQFYSVSQVQTLGLAKLMQDGGAKVTAVESDPNSCKIAGNTPLGEIEGEYIYHAQSGTLTVVVTKKPWMITMSTIENHIRGVLAKVTPTEPLAIPVTTPTVDAEEYRAPQLAPVAPSETQDQTEPTQTEVSALHGSSD